MTVEQQTLPRLPAWILVFSNFFLPYNGAKIGQILFLPPVCSGGACSRWSPFSNLAFLDRASSLPVFPFLRKLQFQTELWDFASIAGDLGWLVPAPSAGIKEEVTYQMPCGAEGNFILFFTSEHIYSSGGACWWFDLITALKEICYCRYWDLLEVLGCFCG